MPPKTAEQKARKKLQDQQKKEEKAAAAEAAASEPLASAVPDLSSLSISATPDAPPPPPPSTTTAQSASASSFANASSSPLLCLPLDSLAYLLTYLPAREVGACLIASSYITKAVLPSYCAKFVASRCKSMLPSRADTLVAVDLNMQHVASLLTKAVTCGPDLAGKAVVKLIKKHNKSLTQAERDSQKNNPHDSLSSLPTSPLSFPSFARFIDEALKGYSRLRTGGKEEEDMLPHHQSGRFVSCSPEHSVMRAGGGLKKGGGSGVITWGVGKRGQLGIGKREDRAAPSPVFSGIGFKVRVVQVAAGGGLVRVAHTLLLTDAGKVLSFGCAMYGALGHGFSAGSQLPDETKPRYIEQLFEETVTCVAAGELHSACVTSDGDCYTWGEGFCGQLGQCNKSPSLEPGLVADEFEHEIAVSVTCGARHTIVLTDEGTMWSFGLGFFGVLGRSFTPFQVRVCVWCPARERTWAMTLFFCEAGAPRRRLVCFSRELHLCRPVNRSQTKISAIFLPDFPLTFHILLLFSSSPPPPLSVRGQEHWHRPGRRRGRRAGCRCERRGRRGSSVGGGCH